MKKDKIISGIIGIILISILLIQSTIANPQINFISPTDDDGVVLTRDYTFINTSISSTNNTTAFIDWDESLRLWMRFDNATDFADHSTYSNDGTNNGSNFTDAGYFGGARTFNGTSDYVDCGCDISLNIINAITIEAWIKASSFPASQFPVSKYQVDGHKRCWAIKYASDVVQWRIVPDGTTSYNTLSHTTTIDTNWHHVAGTYDGTTMRIYLDGVEGGSTLASDPPFDDVTVPVNIGRYITGSYFNGTIDEVRIWSRALSNDEIKASYNATLNRLYGNFTSLEDDTYNYIAHIQNVSGIVNQTETRTLIVYATGLNVTTENATDVGTNYATFNGNLTGLIDSSATVWFEYGMVSDMYMYETEKQTLNSNGAFTQDVKGPNIIPGETYYFRAVGNASGDASGDNNTVYGEPESNVTSLLTPIPTQNFDKHYDELKEAKFNLTKLAIVIPKTYTNIMGDIFFGLLFALIFIAIWLRHEDVGIPALLGILVGGAIWAFLPGEFVSIAYSLIVISLGALIYQLIKGRG